MAQARYSVIFTGAIVDGTDPATVKANLGKLFKVAPDRIEAMFSGKPVVIKKDLDVDQAKGYRNALLKAGARVTIVDDSAAATSPEPEPAPEPESRAPVSASPADDLPPAARRDAPPEAPDFTLAEVGVTLIEPAVVPPADFDTTQFDLAEVGVTLVEPEPVPRANFDTSGMTLDPPGTILAETQPPAPAKFDTSALSLADNE